MNESLLWRAHIGTRQSLAGARGIPTASQRAKEIPGKARLREEQMKRMGFIPANRPQRIVIPEERERLHQETLSQASSAFHRSDVPRVTGYWAASFRCIPPFDLGPGWEKGPSYEPPQYDIRARGAPQEIRSASVSLDQQAEAIRANLSDPEVREVFTQAAQDIHQEMKIGNGTCWKHYQPH